MVLVDLTPEALISRLQAGKIYPSEKVDAALNNFFKIENLAALREVGLRQVAEDVGSKRLVFSQGSRSAARGGADVADGPKAVGERLLALVRPSPARSAWSGAPGARRSGSAPPSTCSR